MTAAAPCPIFVINLDGSSSRMDGAARQIADAGLAFERIPAIDGRLLGDVELARLCPRNSRWFFAPLTRGEVGCYLSHLRALEAMEARGAERCVVLEDDFELLPGFGDCLRELCALGPSLPDAVKLYGARRRGETVMTMPSGRTLVRSSSPPICSVCTLWTREGARKLVAASRTLRRPVDVQMKHWWEMGLEVLWVAPPQVGDSIAFTAASTIGDRKVRDAGGRLRQVGYHLSYAAGREYHYARAHGVKAWLRSMMPVPRTEPPPP